MNLIKKIPLALKNIFTEPHSTIRYYLFVKLNYDKIFENKFKKKYKILNWFLNASGSDKMYPPQYHDLENLINVVRKIKPKLVLELGGGYSTIAIAYALSENLKSFGIDGKLYSYDQSLEYLELTKKMLPNELKKFVTFKYSKLKKSTINDIDVSLFEDLEPLNYDLVYEDRYDLVNSAPIAGDILFLYKKTNNLPSIVVDGKWKTVYFLEKELNQFYNISISKIFKRANFIKK